MKTQIAIEEDRHPHDQATRMLREALVRTGALTDQKPEIAAGSPDPGEAA